jgi:diguanylate cyclase (GGDEF)-like protein
VRPLESFDDEEPTTSVSLPPAQQAVAMAFDAAMRARATVTLVTGPTAGAIYTLGDETVIGRGKECAIRIDDLELSRKHAIILRQSPTTYLLQDLDARNGTFVSGARISRHSLADADRIRLGTNVVLRFGFIDERDANLLQRMYETSVIDGLTGAYNRRHFTERLVSEIAYAKRHKTQLSLLMFDLDHFKAINDTLGHLWGDRVLSSVAAAVKRTLRAEDIFARYGGEEFAIIARGIDVDRAYLLAERVRTVVQATKVEVEGVVRTVTISVGVASLACCGQDYNLDTLVGRADERLYAAKREGRNRAIGATR